MAEYNPRSHDGKLFVERTVDGTRDYAGPYPYAELTAKIQALRSGEIEWSDQSPFAELAPLERWPLRAGSHHVDIQRVDGGHRVTVAKPARKVQRDGEIESIPGFDATSRALYPSEEEAKLAAMTIIRDLKADGQLRENDFDIEDRIGSTSRPDRLARAPITADEYRKDRPFAVRDRLPRRRGDFFRAYTNVDGEHRVAFDGNNSVSTTPPLPSQRHAQELVAKLNRLQERGAKIPFRAYEFSQSRQSDRRVFVDRIGDRYHVLFNGPNKLGRSRPFETEREAGDLQKVIAAQVRRRETINWRSHGFLWGKHPDRLGLSEVAGGHRLQYEYKERIAVADVVIESKDEATQTLDTLRRQLYQGQPLDTTGWTFQRSGKSLTLRVVETQDERFRIVTGTGRFYHQTFDDHTAADAKRDELNLKIAGGLEPDGPEWPFADQLTRVRLSKSAETSIDRLAKALQADNAKPKATETALGRASTAFGKQLALSLEPLTSPERRQLATDLGQFSEVKATRSELGMLSELLKDPRFTEPILDPTDRREAEPFLDRRMALEARLAELPQESRLASGIARQLQGKSFDPQELASSLTPELQSFGRDLLNRYQEVQQEYLPRVAALAHASQIAGRTMPVELLGQGPTRWIGSVKNLAPPQVSGLIATARQSIQATKRVMQPERAAGLAH